MSTFPQIVTGVTTQLPYVSARRCNVCKVTQDSGQQYAYYWDANTLGRWELNFSVLSSAELSTLRTFWEARGAWDSFSFTDPDTGTTYTTCRFDGDTFEVGYTDVNTYSLKLVIVAFR